MRPIRVYTGGVCIVTGEGGSGKSTLLARFTEEVLTQRTATLVLFDFDRPGLNPGDTVALEMEMARQIGYQYPDANVFLREARASNRQSQETAGLESQSESSYRESTRGMLEPIKFVLQSIPRRPLLLVLDTFEEVEQQELTQSVLAWLRNATEVFGGISVRVIFSGRLFGEAAGSLQEG